MTEMKGDKMQGAPVLRDISDAGLMASLAAGDTAALAVLHQRYARIICSLTLRLDPQGGLQHAEDLTQEVFLTLYESAGRYRDEGKLKSWLCGITAQKTRSARRRRAVRSGLMRVNRSINPGHSSSYSAPVDERLSARSDVTEALLSLSDKQREVLVLHSIEGLSGAEIAEALNIKTSAVWVRLHRARKTMAAALADTRPGRAGR
jgi:RNA polymerase sigma-70 factor (ECF subfamily)